MFDIGKLSPRNFDWKLFIAVALLVIMGLAAVYSVDLSRGSELSFFKKQLLSFGIGMVLFFWASISQRTLWRYAAKWAYLVSVILLAAVLIFGREIRGSQAWFIFQGMSFQPVELAKIGLILLLAYIISSFGRRFERPLFFMGTGCVTLILVVLVLKQPDLGSAALLGMIWFGLAWMVGARRSYMAVFIGAVVILAILGWFFFFKPYQKERITTFLYPGRQSLEAGYNLNQAMIAVGAGRWFGRGLGRGSQSQLRFLPEAQTDFVFSVIAEELGFAGVMVMLILFGVFFWRLLVIIRSSRDDFISATAAGALILFMTQFFTNIGANLGLLPITGVTLPFVSYGGSSLVMNLLLVGIVESAAGRKS